MSITRMSIAKYGIPILIIVLLIASFYTPTQVQELVEESFITCVSSVCVEQPGDTASVCESYPPRMGNIMLVKDRETQSRAIIIHLSATSCLN